MQKSNVMRIVSKLYIWLPITLGLAACQAPTEVSEPVASKSLASSVIKKQPVSQYLCEQNKVVRVRLNSTRKNSPVTVTFNNVSHKLPLVVSPQGKKYSNIRWIWFVDKNGKAILMDNRHNTLAKNCVKARKSK